MTHVLVGVSSVSVAILASGLVFSETYPSKPIRLVTAAAGGGGDFTSRLLAQGLSGALGQQIIVDNRPTGPIQGQIVSQAQPDGHTLSVAGTGVWMQPLLRTNVGYDALRDFAPVSLIEMSVNVISVNPAVPAKSVKELIALAKGRPETLNFGAAGVGSSTHLAAELFRHMAGIKVVYIPSKGAAQSLTDLLSGQVHYIFSSLASVAPHIKTEKVKPLAVTSAHTTVLAPELPTIAASGLAGYEAVNMTGMFAPAKTPAAIVNRLSQEVARFMKQPDIRQKFFNGGVEAVGSTPQEFAAALKSDLSRMSKVIKDADIRVE